VTHAVVLLGHGSPDPRAAAGLRELAAQVAARVPETPVQVAFLDHDDTTFDVTARALTATGCTKVTVVPMFLSTGHHVRVDVPRVVGEAQQATGLRCAVGRALGSDDALLDLLEPHVAADAPAVLAVAGTRDDVALTGLNALAEGWSRRRGTPVALGHASIGSPDVATALAHITATADVAPAIVTYALFDGVLVDRIASVAAAAGVPATPPLLRCDPDGLADLVLRRL
jgi:sirohydrochlorin ferrochelatase